MISMDKKYKTNDGREVLRVLCVDAPGPYPVVALVPLLGGGSGPFAFDADGGFQGNPRHAISLIEVKPEHTVWVNLYGFASCGPVESASLIYAAKESADRMALSHRIVCVQVTFREGDGLDHVPAQPPKCQFQAGTASTVLRTQGVD